MTFYEKVNALCLERGTSITAVATALGYSQSAPTTWKNSKGLPRANTIKKLSEYFGVPISYLTGEDFPLTATPPETQKNSPTEPMLNEGEKTMLDLFKEVPEDKKQLVLDMIRVAITLR